MDIRPKLAAKIEKARIAMARLGEIFNEKSQFPKTVEQDIIVRHNTNDINNT